MVSKEASNGVPKCLAVDAIENISLFKQPRESNCEIANVSSQLDQYFIFFVFQINDFFAY